MKVQRYLIQSFVIIAICISLFGEQKTNKKIQELKTLEPIGIKIYEQKWFMSRDCDKTLVKCVLLTMSIQGRDDIIKVCGVENIGDVEFRLGEVMFHTQTEWKNQIQHEQFNVYMYNLVVFLSLLLFATFLKV